MSIFSSTQSLSNTVVNKPTVFVQEDSLVRASTHECLTSLTTFAHATAVLNLKIALFVLIKMFHVEHRDGVKVEIERFQSLLARPKLCGEPGYQLPMRISLAQY